MKTFRIVLLLVILVFSFELNAQTWLWGREGICKGDGEGWSVAANQQGYGFLTGFFQDTLKIGTTTLYANPNTAQGFIEKYENTGNLKWAFQSYPANSSSDAAGFFWGVTTDNKGNSYLTGSFTDSITIGSFTMYVSGTEEEFVAKIDSNGTVKWVQYNGITSANSTAVGEAIALDSAGNIYVTGRFGDTVVMGTTTLYSPRITPSMFLVKYDSAGDVIWAKQSTNNNGGDCVGQGITVDKWANIYVTGLFSDTVHFGSSISIADNSSSADVFLIKYDSSGDVKWARQAIPYSNTNMGNSVVTDKSGNPIITGQFQDSIYFGNTRLYSHAGPSDIFLVKYDTSGGVNWAKAAMNIDGGNWAGSSLALDDSGRIYLSGGRANISSGAARIQFGSIILTSYPTSATDASILFEFDSLGNALCGSLLPSGGDDQNQIAIDPSGKYRYFGGDNYMDTLITGADTLIVYPSTSGESPFLVRWEPCPNVVTAIFHSESLNNAVSVYPNPNSGLFTLSLANINEKCKVEFYNVLGEKVYYATLKQVQGDNSINISSQPSGVYLYRVLSENGNLIGKGKVVVEK